MNNSQHVCKKSTSASILLILLFSVIHVSAFAQQIEGTIIDKTTKTPIAFANITYGQYQGTISDINGKFLVEATPTPKQLTFSCLGYESTTVQVINLASSSTIELVPVNFQLNEIAVTPGENPALRIMRQVIANADRYNPSLYDAYTCILYHKMTVGYDIPEDIEAEVLPELMEKLGLEPNSYMMLFESVSEKKHLEKGKDKERLISGRVSGLKNTFLSSLPALLQPFGFYDKYISLLGVDYLNPASKPGLSSYTFTLQDTIISEKGDSLFYISYQPKKAKNFRGIQGSFHVHGPSWAIQTVSAQTAGGTKDVTLFIRQNYSPNEEGLWFPNQLESSLNFGNTSGSDPYPMIGKGKSYVTAINTDVELDPKEFNNVKFEDASMAHHSPDVGTYRYEPLSAKDSMTYHLLDSLGRKYPLDALVNFQLSMVSGYIPMGNLQLDIRRLLNFNSYEGFKAGLGLYTSPKMSKYFMTGGYLVYGFKDKDTKYGASLDITPFSNPENKFMFSWKDDLNATGSISFLDGIDKRSSETFKGFLTETMDHTQELKIGTQFRWLQYFKTEMTFKSADITPQIPYRFLSNTTIASAYSHLEGEIKLKWAHKETFTQTPLGRLSEGTKWPKLWINAAFGEWENSTKGSYQRLEGQYEQEIHYPSAMYTIFRLQGAKLYGEFPGTLLYSSLGSYKSFTLHIPYTFATMRLNEFAASEFSALYLRHGIPLFLNKNQSFKPEIVLSTNLGWGNAAEGVQSFEKGFYESGVYFKNLFSNFLFQYGFSVHYRYGPYQLPKAIDNWAFKLGLDFSF